MFPRSRRSSHKKSSGALPEEDSLLRRLEEALSEEEIRRVVASSLLVLDDASRKRLLARVAPETAAALIPALDPPRKPARTQKAIMPAAGKGKLRQEWNRLWQEWDRIVGESGAGTAMKSRLVPGGSSCGLTKGRRPPGRPKGRPARDSPAPFQLIGSSSQSL